MDKGDYNKQVCSPLVAACVLMPLVWLALLVAAPAAAFGVPASGFAYALGSLICHQRPERSFDLFAAQMPVCARCIGLYVGAATGAVMTIVAGVGWEPPAGAGGGGPLLGAVPPAGALGAAAVWGGAPPPPVLPRPGAAALAAAGGAG